MATYQHKDALGTELNVGDFVVIGHRYYAGLVFGRINEVTKNKVRVKWGPEPWENMLKEPGNVCKINSADATVYCLMKGI